MGSEWDCKGIEDENGEKPQTNSDVGSWSRSGTVHLLGVTKKLFTYLSHNQGRFSEGTFTKVLRHDRDRPVPRNIVLKGENTTKKSFR